MPRSITKHLVAIASVGIALTIAISAADLNKSLQDTEGRKRTAESGLAKIKAKSAADVEAVRAAYDQAASQNNAWLDVVVQSVDQPATAAPNVAATVDGAASAFVKWVATRNRALGEFELTGTAAESVKKKVAMDLTDVATEAWKSNRQRDANKRSAFTKLLSERLRWKTWDLVQ